MLDLGENPLITTLCAIWDLTKWWLAIGLTWGFGLLAGIRLGRMGWYWTSKLAGMNCLVIIPGFAITFAALFIVIAMNSRKLAIKAAIANFIAWVIIGLGCPLNTQWIY